MVIAITNEILKLTNYLFPDFTVPIIRRTYEKYISVILRNH